MKEHIQHYLCIKKEKKKKGADKAQAWWEDYFFEIKIYILGGTAGA